MDLRRACTLSLLLILALHAEVINGDSSVVFLDSPTRNYLRHSPAQTDVLSPLEVGAAASVLLGVAPPSTLTEASSAKLNELLVPNPFDRPQAVLLLEVTGAEGVQLTVGSGKSVSFKVEGTERADIQVSEEDVSLVSLNEASSDNEVSDKDLSDFASWFGGSYVEDASGPLNGELVIPAANGGFLRLHMSKTADRKFTMSLLSLINNIRRAMEMHGVITKSESSPAELITGRFDGIKALQDHYGTEGIAQTAFEVFVASISKIFDSLQAAHEGRIVGVLVHDGSRASDVENMFHITIAPRSYARSLQENVSPIDIKIAEVVFVRLTLAWITGIILLVATLMGICYLFNMPITKDTLLYSNVKLD